MFGSLKSRNKELIKETIKIYKNGKEVGKYKR